MSVIKTIQSLSNRRIGVMLVLGFASGLPLALSGNTLQAWMTHVGVDITTIGIFTLVGLPYTLKFIWAPMMDRFTPPWLGRRRGWMIVTQVGLVFLIGAMAYTSPTNRLWLLAFLATCLAFMSASQDVVFDAYRTDVLRKHERGMGAAVTVLSYRIAMWTSFSATLIFADVIGWRNAYLIMAGLMIIGIVGTLISPEPEEPARPPASLQEAVIGPFNEFFSRPGAYALLLLIVLYKLGDAFAGSLTTAFLLRGLGFTLTELGVIYKALAIGATIVGALWGGLLMARWSLYRSLMVFGILQAVTNLLFVVFAWMGKDYAMMVIVVGLENLAGGMGTAAFVALVMALCHHSYTATQYALLTSFAVLGRTFLGPSSGFIVEAQGWIIFFVITTLAALPGLLLLWHKATYIRTLDHETRLTHISSND